MQVSLVWDSLLWAAALRGKLCSQDSIADLLQVRRSPPPPSRHHDSCDEGHSACPCTAGHHCCPYGCG